jgi:2-dehydro-3-deoxyglucarate aldolase
VHGVDAFIIGPYDLSASLGDPGNFENPRFLEAMTQIRETSKRCHKSSGIHVVEPDMIQLKNRISEGYNFIAYSVDIRMLDTLVRTALNEVGQR